MECSWCVLRVVMLEPLLRLARLRWLVARRLKGCGAWGGGTVDWLEIDAFQQTLNWGSPRRSRKLTQTPILIMMYSWR